MKVLVDLNVVLDVILSRQPFFAESSQVWNAHQAGTIDGCLVATAMTNLFYIVRRLAGESTARTAVGTCLATFAILPVDEATLHDADKLPGTDFEDNVCIACAVRAGVDFVVTRDAAGFVHSPVPAISPAELVVRLNQSNP